MTEIKVPTFDPASQTAKSIGDQLRNSYNDELFGQYVARLESDLGTSINQAGVNQAIGRTSN